MTPTPGTPTAASAGLPASRPAQEPADATAAVVRAEAVIDLDAVEANTRVLCGRAGPATLMAVVKADGYGHGALPVARAALRGGAVMLGVALPAEAVQLRAAGIDAPVLAWLWVPGEDIRPALQHGVALAVSSVEHLDAVLAANPSEPPALHLKVDTGLGRNGVTPAALRPLADRLAAADRSGLIRLVGAMSHLASADVPGDPATRQQLQAFDDMLAVLAEAGLRPRWRHIANTAGLLEHPASRLDLVRAGIGLYGLSPVADPAGLRPAMTLRARVALVKRVPADHGVSYGMTYRTPRETTLALVPVGYADGVPRNAGGVAQVLLRGRLRTIAGRVAMDQFVLDCGDDPVRIGDEVVLFGPGEHGEQTAKDWAAATGTIDYEIVTRVGARVPRRQVHGGRADPRGPAPEGKDGW